MFLSQIIDVPVPAHVYLFFRNPRIFKLDIFQGRHLYELFLTFESDPFSVKLAELGFDKLDFLPNSGSILPIMAVILMIFIFKMVINKIVCKSFKSCRKIGIWAYMKHPWLTLKKIEGRFF
jgi:hypothetical protein